MINELKQLLNNAYAPYSKYRVAAILETNDGKIFTGVNIENASFGATICAERVAIYKAISEGYRSFKKLEIMVDDDKIGTCCFLGRQVMLEFFDKNMPIYCYDNKGNFEMFKVSDLCPYPFSKENLEWKVVLLV